MEDIMWAKIDRKKVTNVMALVHSSFGFSHKGPKTSLMEYSVASDSDGKSFVEYKLSSPDTKLKARLDRISEKHYKIGFYRVSLTF